MNYFFKKLNNGLRLILIPVKNTKAASVLVQIGTGSKYESKRLNGISHFLEHMMFKGTKKRPNPLEITKILDGIGADFNAFTGKEMTGFYIKLSSQYLDTALDILSDIYLNSLFDENELNKEKGVIIEEINMYYDLPKYYVQVLFEKLLYGNQPAGWDIAGKKENILKIKRKDLINYLNNHYSSLNTVISIAGNFNKKSILKKAENYFGKIKKFSPKKKKRVRERQIKPGVLIQYKKTDQSHLVFGFRSFGIFDKRRYSLLLAAIILGGNMSSRLFKKLRDELGIAYYINTEPQFYLDSGYLATSCGLNNKRIKEGLKEIIKEHYRIINDINESEIRMAKDYIKGKLELKLEDSLEIASFFSNQELLLNKILTPDELFKKIETVSKKDIKKTLKDIFKPNRMNLSVIGPFKNKKVFDRLLKI